MAEILEPSTRKRKLAAILQADVVGFSRWMGEDEAGTHRALGEFRRAVDPLIAAHGGRIVGTAGDSLLADFSSVVDAVNCAVEMQRASRAINGPIPSERRLELRIGVNLGDVIVDGDDIFGDGVNVAARLEALAQPAPCAFRRPFTTRSGTSSISLTARSAAIASRTSSNRCVLTH
jgi:adenylate cyclase